MAVTARPRAGEPGPDDPSPPVVGRGRPPRGGFELWAWLFMRLSGLVLLVLAVGHVLIMHVVDEGVDRVDFRFVQVRWGSPFWKTWDWLMLMLALIHGVNGLRVISLDYIRRRGLRLATNTIFTVIGGALLVLGSFIVITFDPANWPPVPR